jgi:hypothetical protein
MTQPYYNLDHKVKGSQRNPPVSGDERIVNVNARCIQDIQEVSIGIWGNMKIKVDKSACAWAPLRHVGVYDGGTRAQATFTVNSRPVDLEMTFDIEKAVIGGMKQLDASYDLFYGDIVNFQVPVGEGVTAVGKGTTSSQIEFNFVLGQNDDRNLLRLQKEAPGPETVSYQYRVLRPAGFD